MCRAAVHELSPTTNFDPINLEKLFSNCFTFSPYPNHGDLKTPLIDLISSLLNDGLKSLI